MTPMWLAQASVPLAALWAKLSNGRPLYTSASLRVIRSNCQFDRSLTERDLGYTSRPPLDMVHDALAWFRNEGRLRRGPIPMLVDAQ